MKEQLLNEYDEEEEMKEQLVEWGIWKFVDKLDKEN
jgi:hypothetical protein